MLDLDAIDLGDLCMALEDHDSDGYDTSWWIDPVTGEIRFHMPDVEGETVDDLEEAGLVPIPPTPPSAGYGDMVDFIAAVPDRRARDLLDRAIQGRGAFRRFKDTLFDFPELREEWFAFRDARARRRAVEWLEHQGVISEAAARAGRARYPDPPLG